MLHGKSKRRLNPRLPSVALAAALLLLNIACSDSGDEMGAQSGGAKHGGAGSAAGGAAGATGGVKSAQGGSQEGGSQGGGSQGGVAPAAATPVDLGTAENYAILAKSGVSTVPDSVITGDLAVSPAAATAITGFGLSTDAANAMSTSPQVTGNVYAADYAAPTPTTLTTAVLDMELAFTDAAGRTPDVTELGAGDIGGLTLEPGVYKWGTGLLIPADVTLSGSGEDVWILQVAQDLSISSDTRVILKGGALAQNVFWQVSGPVVLDTGAHFEGIVLSQTSVTLRTGASIEGRLLAQTAVSLDTSTVAEPSR